MDYYQSPGRTIKLINMISNLELLFIFRWLWTYFLVTDIPARSLIKDLPVSVELSSQSSETINAIIQSFGPKADI